MEDLLWSSMDNQRNDNQEFTVCGATIWLLNFRNRASYI